MDQSRLLTVALSTDIGAGIVALIANYSLAMLEASRKPRQLFKRCWTGCEFPAMRAGGSSTSTRRSIRQPRQSGPGRQDQWVRHRVVANTAGTGLPPFAPPS